MTEIWRKKIFATQKNTSTKNSQPLVNNSKQMFSVWQYGALNWLTQPRAWLYCWGGPHSTLHNLASFPGNGNKMPLVSVQDRLVLGHQCINLSACFLLHPRSEAWISCRTGITDHLAPWYVVIWRFYKLRHWANWYGFQVKMVCSRSAIVEL